MRRFKSTFFHLTTWPRISARRTSQAIRTFRASGYLVPVTWNTIWWVHQPDRPTHPAHMATRDTRQIGVSRASVADRIRNTLSGFVLWFGLLFSAALVGTFIVLGVVMAYALVMSLIGH